MILVTGATGTIGRDLVGLLAEGGSKVRALTRAPERARVPAGVEVVGGDFGDPASLDTALAGATAVFALSAPGPDVAAHDLALLTAVRRAGVRRVVKLSAIGSGDRGLDGEVIGSWHVPGEQALRESDLDWTILRPTTFASNTLSWAAPIAAAEPILNLSADGRQGVVDPADVAAVAAAVLTGPGHAGATYTLTGPDLLSVPEQAAVLAEALGAPVAVKSPDEEEARRLLAGNGLTGRAADAVLAGNAYVAAGLNAVVTADVRRVLGRPPASYADWANRHRAAFLPPAP